MLIGRWVLSAENKLCGGLLSNRVRVKKATGRANERNAKKGARRVRAFRAETYFKHVTNWQIA